MAQIEVEDPERNLPPGDSPINMALSLQCQSNGSVHGLTTLPSTVPRRMLEAGELMPVSVAPDMCDKDVFTPFHPHYQDEEFGPRNIIVRTLHSALLPTQPGSLGLICSSPLRRSTGSWTIIQIPMTPGHSSNSPHGPILRGSTSSILSPNISPCLLH